MSTLKPLPVREGSCVSTKQPILRLDLHTDKKILRGVFTSTVFYFSSFFILVGGTSKPKASLTNGVYGGRDESKCTF